MIENIVRDIISDQRALIESLLQENAFTGDCSVEILAALQTMETDVLEAIDKNKEDQECDDDNHCECSHDCLDEIESRKGCYVLQARTIGEEARIEQFIEDLKATPYV